MLGVRLPLRNAHRFQPSWLHVLQLALHATVHDNQVYAAELDRRQHTRLRPVDFLPRAVRPVGRLASKGRLQSSKHLQID